MRRARRKRPADDPGARGPEARDSAARINDAGRTVEYERDRALLATIIDSCEDAIITKTLDGVITSWNPAAERMLGYAAAEAIGRPITLIIPEDRLEEEQQIIAKLRKGERIEHYETVRRTKDGRAIDISLTISPIRDSEGSTVGASKIARDITVKKLADRALWESQQALLESDRRKDEFLATLAHELRNPLAPIRNSLQILRMSGQDSPEAQRLQNMMERQVAHMVRLVDDLLELSRISRGTIELKNEVVALGTIVEQALETSRPVIEAGFHRVEVHLPQEPVAIDGDPVRLSQVLSNLFDNAAKYSNQPGVIRFDAQRRGDTVVVSVRDSGIGIPAGMLSRVFDMFAQVENPLRRHRDGLGIGLSLVRTLVRMHGGTVEARSEGIGQGAEFVVTLPIVAEPSRDRRSAASSPDDGVEIPAACRVLVVDDNRDSADSLGMVLECLGAEVSLVYDGASALEAIEAHRPSVVLMDLGMPGMDGCEVARRIRMDRRHDGVRLIALTGWGQDQDRRRSNEAGFDHHLVKPVEMSALKALLRLEVPALSKGSAPS